MGKVLNHALKPRVGKLKGKNLGGDWVHKALGDSEEGLSRPDLVDTMRAEEAAAAAAAPAAAVPEEQRPSDSVLRLGGGVRNVTTVVSKALQVGGWVGRMSVGIVYWPRRVLARPLTYLPLLFLYTHDTGASRRPHLAGWWPPTRRQSHLCRVPPTGGGARDGGRQGTFV